MSNKDTADLVTAGRTLNYAAGIYDVVMNVISFGRIKYMRSKAIDLLDFRPDDKILDLGCGTGAMTILIAQRLNGTGCIVGIDAAANMIRVANKNLKRVRLEGKCSFRAALAETLPFENETFDFCFSSMFYHHLPIELKIASIREAHRVLKPGGTFVSIDVDKPGNIFAKAVVAASYLLLVQPAIRENAEGVLPGLIMKAGFEGLELIQRKWNMISVFHAVKPMRI